MEIVKERTLAPGQRVFVYYNLHRGGYSIKDKKTGLVVAYASTVHLKSCQFKVSESGRLRTVKEKRKRVHAMIEGDYVDSNALHDLILYDIIYYNPYETELFTNTRTGKAVYNSHEVYFANKVCYIVRGNSDGSHT